MHHLQFSSDQIFTLQLSTCFRLGILQACFHSLIRTTFIMQAFCIALLLCLGAGRSIPVSKSRDILKDDLNSLPEDVLRHISSQLPVVDRLLLSETSSSLRGVAKLNDAEMVSVLLLSHFGNETCLFFALSIEEAPPGFMTRVVTELLRSKAKRSLQAACMACTVGYVELIDVISDEFLGVNLFRDVADLATLPTSELLKMHALPKLTFLQVLSDKYKHAGYGAFFKDQAWYSQYCSYTVMSHALHLYNELNGAIDFEPVPFGHIAATQTLSERTQGALRNMASDLIETRLRPGISEECFYTFSLLQLVLSPGAEIQFFSKSSSAFRTEFLVTACKTGRLDWVCPIRALLSCCLC